MTIAPRTDHHAGRPTDRPAGPTRRALMRGAAWAAPSALIAVAAPAIAASSPELNGWVQVATSCSTWSGAQTLSIDGTGRYPVRGIWVDQAPASPAPSGASITYYFPSTRALTWTRASGGSATWSTPARDGRAPRISGFTAYTSTYSGTWTYDATARRQIADARPAFRVTNTLDSCRTVQVHALRTVTLGGTDYSLQRGPVTLQMTLSRSRRSAPTPQQGTATEETEETVTSSAEI